MNSPTLDFKPEVFGDNRLPVHPETPVESPSVVAVKQKPFHQRFAPMFAIFLVLCVFLVGLFATTANGVGTQHADRPKRLLTLQPTPVLPPIGEPVMEHINTQMVRDFPSHDFCTGTDVVCSVTVTEKPVAALRALAATVPKSTSIKKYRVHVAIVAIDEEGR
jgi:hypothetical protein